MDTATLSSGYHHEREIGLADREFPFANEQAPDVYPLTLRRTFSVRRARFNPRMALRTAYTNLLTYSEDFTQAVWNKTNVTNTAAQRVNPWDGTATFSKLLETAANAEHRLDRSYTFTAASAHTLSCFVAAGLTRNFARLMSYDGTTFRSAFFDLANGAVFGTPSGCTAAIRRFQDPAGNISFKLSITFTPLAAAGSVYLNLSTDGSTVSYLGSTSAGLYASALQLELASSAGPYVSTTSASRTVQVPDVDLVANSSGALADAFAFLAEESKVTWLNSIFGTLTRLYARVPADQVRYDTRTFNRPSGHGIKKGSYWGVSFDDGDSTWYYAVRKTIAAIGALTSDTKSVTGTISGTGTIAGTGSIAGSGSISRSGSNPTSVAARVNGTLPSFTINVTGPTAGTSTFFDSSNVATITSAFTTRGLTNVSVTKTPYRIAISWTGAAGIEVAGGSPSVNGGANNVEITSPTAAAAATDTETKSETDSRSLTDTRATLDTRNTTNTHSVTETYLPSVSIRAFSTTGAHGASPGDRVAFFQGDRIVAMSIVITTATGVDFTVPLADVSGKDFAAATVVFSSGAAFRYVNGPKDCTVKVTRKFYLPNFTPGISTGADIPATPLYADSIGWVDAISSGLAYAAIGVSGISTWFGPILCKTIEEVQMSDALESRDVNA